MLIILKYYRAFHGVTTSSSEGKYLKCSAILYLNHTLFIEQTMKPNILHIIHKSLIAK